ncbi:WD40/YVTN/BNR-like repeat-containing protein [Pseudoduganella sp. UC29_106]|uniref:WD40/YVTN/BNR-like repeat-containing protein n=1 Tax=Pseudoduganella sp. UC29_106 TaxID=3374553 RepID=UPI003757BE1B
MSNAPFGYVFLAAALLCGAAAAGEYKGPLDVAAKVNTEFAQSHRLTAVASTGRNLVAVGPRGHILTSGNGGRDWTQVPSPVSSDLVAVRFVNESEGWAVGHDGIVLHSVDAGRTWARQLDGRQAAAIVDQYYKRAAAAGDEQAVKQQDALARFVQEGADKPFLDVLFLTPKEGFVVGAFNAAFRTRDGGQTWEPLLTRVDNPNSNHLYSLATHGGELYAAGERGLLLRWDRQQERFVALSSPYQGSFFGLLDTGKELVAYGLRGNVYATSDGGKSWSKVDTPAPDSVVGGTSLAGGRYVLVTRGGRLLLNKGEGSGFEKLAARHAMAYAAVTAAGGESLVTAGSGGVQVETISALAQEK